MHKSLFIVIFFAFTASSITACGGGGGSSSSPAAPPPPPPPPPPPATDSTAPTVSSTLPADLAVGVDRLSNVTATFDENLDATTVNGANFTVTRADGTAVSGTVSYEAASNEAIFTPDVPWSLLTQYSVTLSTALTDVAGNGLANQVNWSFSIADGIMSAPAAIDQGAADTSIPRLAVDASGNVISVWIRVDASGIPDIWTNRYSAADGTWGTPQPLETDAGAALNPVLVMDAAGNAIAVWDQDDALNLPKVWARRYDAASESWGSPVMLSDSGGIAIFPTIAIDPNGSAIAVWEESDDTGELNIRASRYSADSGNWSASVLLENAAGAAFVPHVAMDDEGNGIVVWEQEGVPDSLVFDVQSNRYAAGTGTWSGAAPIEPDAGDAFNPRIAMNASGDAIVGWEQETVPGSVIYSARVAVFSAANDSWGEVTTFSVVGGDVETTTVGIDDDGNATVLWREDSGAGFANLHASQRPAANSNWSAAVTIETRDAPVGPPQLGTLPNGNSIVVYQQLDDTGTGDLLATTYSAATGTWDAPTLIESGTGDVFRPRVAMDASGNAIVGWAQDDGTGTNTANVFASRYVAGTNTWGAATMLNDGTGDDVGLPGLAIHPSGVAAIAWPQVNVSGAVDIFASLFD